MWWLVSLCTGGVAVGPLCGPLEQVLMWKCHVHPNSNASLACFEMSAWPSLVHTSPTVYAYPRALCGVLALGVEGKLAGLKVRPCCWLTMADTLLLADAWVLTCLRVVTSINHKPKFKETVGQLSVLYQGLSGFISCVRDYSMFWMRKEGGSGFGPTLQQS